MAAQTRYVLSVDVEDYFQVEAFARQVSRTEWDRWPSRVTANTHRTLDVCDEFQTRGTYFILGWVARKFPGLVRDIHARGHELACHSFWHRPVYSLSPAEFRQDVREARDAIEQAAGTQIIGYRAPSWSITPASIWALDILAEEGFRYDSSIFPIHHDLYGFPGSNRLPHRRALSGGRELPEFPPATARIFGVTLPSAGGGYLRILPFWFTRWAVRQLERESTVVVVYLHPWELDPDQPRVTAPFKSRFRHYTNLRRMEGRLRRLLAGHPFVRFADVLEALPEAQHTSATRS